MASYASSRALSALLLTCHPAPHYPDIMVEIINDYSFTNIVAKRFDAGIRLGEQVAQDMIAVRIGLDIKQCIMVRPRILSGAANP